MAKELQAFLTYVGHTNYAILFNSVGEIWNGSAFVTLDPDDWTDYDIALTEVSPTGLYFGNMPAVPAGTYKWVGYDQADASPAFTDDTVWYETIIWSGTSVGDRALLETILGYVSNIATTGSPTYAAPSSNTLTTGNQTSGTYANVDTDNSTYHVLTDAAGTLSNIYHFTLSVDEVANGLSFKGRWNSTNDTLVIAIYDWIGAAYVTLYSSTGTSGSTDTTLDRQLVGKYTGTGANAGKVNVRISGTGLTTCTLYVDKLVVGRTNTSRSVGYADGAVWVKATGTSGTVPYVNGMADRPCPWTDALTIATALGLTRFRIVNGETITLTGSIANKSLIGKNWNLALEGQVITGAYIDGATVSGISSGTYAEFTDCHFSGTATIGGGHYNFFRCGFGIVTFTMLANSSYNFMGCFDDDPDTATSPIFVFAASAVVGARNWRGAFQASSMASTNKLTLDGAGRLVVTDTSVGGAITIRGFFPPVVAGTGLHSEAEFLAHGGTITQTNRYGNDMVNAEVDTALNTAIPGSPTAGSINERMDAKVSSRLAPTVASRTLDVTETGAAGIDWGNIENMDGLAILSQTSIYGVGAAAIVSFPATAIYFTDESTLETKLPAIKAVTDKLDTGLVADGDVYQATANFLELGAGGGAALDAQGVRDAMKLAPTAGAPATGSIDKHLDDIPTNTYTGTPPTVEQMRAEIDTNSTQLAAILEDTGTTLPAGLAAIRAKTDLLTNASATPVVTPVVGAKHTLTIGTTFATTVTGLTISAGWKKILYTLKNEVAEDDTEAILQVQVSNPAALTDGVLYVEAFGLAARTLGSLTVDQAAGDVAIALGATLLAELKQHSDVVWDIKEIAATEQHIRGTGTADVQWAATHTTS